MKITNEQLKQIIREELQAVLKQEEVDLSDSGVSPEEAETSVSKLSGDPSMERGYKALKMAGDQGQNIDSKEQYAELRKASGAVLTKMLDDISGKYPDPQKQNAHSKFRSKLLSMKSVDLERAIMSNKDGIEEFYKKLGAVDMPSLRDSLELIGKLYRAAALSKAGRDLK